MTKGGTTLHFTYDASGTPQAMLYNNTLWYYYVTNLQGDVVAIVDTSGEVAASYTYDAWGNTLSVGGLFADTIGAINPLRYRGYVYDHETGLYYVSSRYYDPEICRWINADNRISGAGGDILGYNMFAYCFNNPVNMSDPTGNWPKWVEEIGSRFVHTVKIMGRIVASPFKATTAKVGAGIGLGVTAEVTLGGTSVEVGAVTSITDSVAYQKGNFDIQNTTSTSVAFSLAEVFDFKHTSGHSHSYFDKNCTCDIMKSNFEQKTNCGANQRFISNEASFGTVGISGSLYLLLGVEFDISIDFIAWNAELIDIFYDSMSYS